MDKQWQEREHWIKKLNKQLDTLHALQRRLDREDVKLAYFDTVAVVTQMWNDTEMLKACYYDNVGLFEKLKQEIRRSKQMRQYTVAQYIEALEQDCEVFNREQAALQHLTDAKSNDLMGRIVLALGKSRHMIKFGECDITKLQERLRRNAAICERINVYYAPRIQP